MDTKLFGSWPLVTESFLTPSGRVRPHFRGVEGEGARPVLEDVQTGRDGFGVVGGDGEHVDGLVEGCEGVEVGPELHPGALDEVDQRVLREPRGAVERHVLHEVREPPLVVILQYRPGIDREPQLRAMLGVVVLPDEVPEAVRELAGANRGIQRKRSLGGHVRSGRRVAVRLGLRPTARAVGAGQNSRKEGDGGQTLHTHRPPS
jgi:hypothetical protein